MFRGDVVTGNLDEHQSVKSSGQWIRANLTLMAAVVFTVSAFAQALPIQSIPRATAGFSPRDLSGVWMERQNTITFGSEEELIGLYERLAGKS